MSRRLHRCQTCEPEANPGQFSLPRGFTRHDDRVCSSCRRRGVRVEGDQLLVPLHIRIPPRLLLVPKVADPSAPTVAELADSVDLSGFIREVTFP